MGLNEFLTIEWFLSDFAPRIPTFPGPDMAHRAGVLQASLARYYSDTSFFQASRARAGHYSI